MLKKSQGNRTGGAEEQRSPKGEDGKEAFTGSGSDVGFKSFEFGATHD